MCASCVFFMLLFMLFGPQLDAAGPAIDPIDLAGRTPLHVAQSVAAAALLVSHGARLGALAADGDPPPPPHGRPSCGVSFPDVLSLITAN